MSGGPIPSVLYVFVGAGLTGVVYRVLLFLSLVTHSERVLIFLQSLCPPSLFLCHVLIINKPGLRALLLLLLLLLPLFKFN